MKDDKEPAFPVVVDIERFEESLGKYVPHLVPMGGLTKREWFLGMAISNSSVKSIQEAEQWADLAIEMSKK